MISERWINRAKIVGELISTVTVTKVVKEVINNNTLPQTKADSAKVWVGSLIISALVNEAAWHHIDGRIDDVVETVEKIEKAVKESKAEPEDKEKLTESQDPE